MNTLLVPALVGISALLATEAEDNICFGAEPEDVVVAAAEPEYTIKVKHGEMLVVSEDIA